MPPSALILVLIDGLRADVLQEAVAEGQTPHLQGLLGPDLQHGYLGALTSTAPSVTFAAQASLITGAPPNAHDIPGNQFFDRFGVHNRGKPRWFAFDVGETLQVDDALAVFTQGLANQCLGARTLYERFAAWGWTSAVFGHMNANGADLWEPLPTTLLARLHFAQAPLGSQPSEVDRHIVARVKAYLKAHPLPHILTVYLIGLDHESHHRGPQAQKAYLSRVLDPLLGDLQQAVAAASGPNAAAPLWVLAADHGQAPVPADDAHSLRLRWPTERELAGLFDALGLDVLDHPGEGTHCDAVLALNGGMAGIYLRRPRAEWSQPPDFAQQVLPLARLVWRSHHRGNPTPALQGAVEAVLVRSVERDGWRTGYAWLPPEPEADPLPLHEAPLPKHWVDPIARLNGLRGPLSPDILILPKGQEGFYFGPPLSGVHGGLDPAASQAALALGWPRPHTPWPAVREAFLHGLQRQMAMRGHRRPSIADLLPALEYLWAHT